MLYKHASPNQSNPPHCFRFLEAARHSVGEIQRIFAAHLLRPSYIIDSEIHWDHRRRWATDSRGFLSGIAAQLSSARFLCFPLLCLVSGLAFNKPMVLLRVLLCCFPAAECWLNWTRTVLRPCPSWKWDGCIACSRQLIALESFFFFCQSRHTWPCPTNDSGTAWNNPSLNECKRHTLPVTHHTYYLLLNDVGWHALCLVGNNNSLSADKSILLALQSFQPWPTPRY